MAKKQTKKKNSKAFNDKFRRRVVPYRSIIVIGFALIVVVAVVAGYRDMLTKEQAYQESIDSLNEDIAELEEGNSELKEELNNMDTDEFKEKIARERLGMIGADEVLLKESEDGTTGRGTPEEETTEAGDETEESGEESDGEVDESTSAETTESESGDAESENSETSEDQTESSEESTELTDEEEANE